MRGPPMPAKSTGLRRAFSASMSGAAIWSPEASPATMAMRRRSAATVRHLADDSALARGDEPEERPHLGRRRALGLERRLGLLQAETLAIQRLERALEPLDRLRREAAPLEAFLVDAHGSGRRARGHHVRGDILRQGGPHAGKGVRADADVLVHEGVAAEDRPVADRHVAGELGDVVEDRLATHLAIVRQVHVSHDPVLVPQARDADILRRAAVDGDGLADGIAVADLDPGRLAGVLLVLRRRADRGEVPDVVAPADAGVAVEHHVRADPGALADLDVLADDRIGADLDVRGEPRARVHDGARMDLGHQAPAGWTAQRIVASATTAPATRATQANLPMLRSTRSSLTSSSSWSPGITGFLKRALSMPT